MTNITRNRVLRDVLNHSKSNDTSFHIERATSRVSGVQDKTDEDAIKKHLDYGKSRRKPRPLGRG